MAVWYSLWSFGIFFQFWYVWTKKNLATLLLVASWFFQCAYNRRTLIFGFRSRIKIKLFSGLDIKVSSLCEFRKFSAKEIAVFFKASVMIQFLQKLVVFWAKNDNFLAEFFGISIFQINMYLHRIFFQSYHRSKGTVSLCTSMSFDSMYVVEIPQKLVNKSITR
jgi:hypothetical protein